jgi:amino-acid N-acetyltransferase
MSDAPVSMVVVCEDKKVVGCAGYERYGEQALLRSVAVRAGSRRRGIGRLMIHGICEQLRALGVWEVFLLTLHASTFFEALGFCPENRSNLPEGIRASREFSLSCCQTAACLARTLSAKS